MDTLLDLAGLGGSPPPSVRRPVFAITFGPAPAGGGLGGALGGLGAAGGAVAGAGAALGLDGGGGSDAWQRAAVSIVVESGVAPFADVADIVLAADSQAPSVGVGSAGDISLGYDDASPVIVFTGTVEAVSHDLRGATRLTATNGGATLARLRLLQSYEQQSAGDVVNDVAGRAGVGTGTIEDGSDFPFLVLDDRQSAYAQLAALARRCGFTASIAPDGKLRFGPVGDDDPVRTFTYGTDLLLLSVTAATPRVGATTAAGEGAAGSNGQDAWSWLIKDPSPVAGTAGEGDPSRLVPDATLRSSDAVRTAASGLAARANAQTLVGEALVPGEPTVTPGVTIEISEAPHEEMNGRFLVHRVRHAYTKATGFTTRITFTKVGDAGPVGLGLAGALGSLL